MFHSVLARQGFSFCNRARLNFQAFALRDMTMAAREPGGVHNKVLYGEAPPRGPTPYPFIYHFGRKSTPFIYLLLKKGTPFTYLF